MTVLVTACGPDLIVLPAPADYKVSDTTVLEPDLLVVRRADIGARRYEGTPLVVVEILSPSTRRIDLGTKRLAFEAAGVTAYWLVDPDAPSITELRLSAGRYEERPTVRGDDEFVTDVPVALRFAPSSLVSI